MNEFSNPKQVHPPLGAYSHTVKVPPNATWLILSGQVGINASGKLQTGLRRQAEQVFRNILACLRANRMKKEDLVKLVVYLTDSRFVEEYRAARAKVLGGDVLPASTLLVIDGPRASGHAHRGGGLGGEGVTPRGGSARHWSSVSAAWIPAFAGMTAIARATSFPRRRESMRCLPMTCAAAPDTSIAGVAAVSPTKARIYRPC